MPGVIHRKVEVSDEPVEVASGRTGANALILNAGTNKAFLGSEGVTADGDGEGFDLNAGYSLELTLEGRSVLYAVCAAGDQTTLKVIAS